MPPTTAPAMRTDWGQGLSSELSAFGFGFTWGSVFSWACQARREITKRTLLGDGAAAVDRRRRSVVTVVDYLATVAALEAMDFIVRVGY